MNHLSVNIIVPVYNTDKYLKDCIDSLINQTYKNLKIVLVNDCSTDNSLTILKDYEINYPEKIIVIDSKENLKPGGARNLGIRASHSDYIGFVDSDDFVQPQMFELLMDAAEADNVEVVYCDYKSVPDSAFASNYYLTFNNNKAKQLKKCLKHITVEQRMELIASHQFKGVCGGIYRRSIIESNNLFFPENLTYEDNYWAYVVQMLLQSTIIIPLKLYCYRQHDKSITHKKNVLYHYDRIEIANRLLKYVKKNNLMKQYGSIIEFIFIEVFTLNSCIKFIYSFDQPQVDKIQQLKFFLNKEFPHWRKNTFYKNKFSLKTKLKFNLFMILPVKWFIKLAKFK